MISACSRSGLPTRARATAATERFSGWLALRAPPTATESRRSGSTAMPSNGRIRRRRSAAYGVVSVVPLNDGAPVPAADTYDVAVDGGRIRDAVVLTVARARRPACPAAEEECDDAGIAIRRSGAFSPARPAAIRDGCPGSDRSCCSAPASSCCRAESATSRSACWSRSKNHRETARSGRKSSESHHAFGFPYTILIETGVAIAEFGERQIEIGAEGVVERRGTSRRARRPWHPAGSTTRCRCRFPTR